MRFLIFILFLATSVLEIEPARSQEGWWLESTRPAMRQGGWEFGGNLGVGYSSLGGLLIQATPRAQYFVLDRLSVGAIAEYYKSEDFERLGAGPSATLYFLETPSFVAYLAQNLIFSNTSPEFEDISTFQGETALGLNYFFTPSMAIGVSYNKIYPLDDGEVLGNTSLFRTAFLIYM